MVQIQEGSFSEFDIPAQYTEAQISASTDDLLVATHMSVLPSIPFTNSQYGLYRAEIDSPPVPLRSLKSQSSQSHFSFHFLRRRAESEKQQPFGQNSHNLVSTNIILDIDSICKVSGGLMFYVCRDTCPA